MTKLSAPILVILAGILCPAANAASVTTGNTQPSKYQWDSLTAGKAVYIDRPYAYTQVPSAYDSATVLRTANDDKRNTSDRFLSFDVNQPVSVFVAHDVRITEKPSWLSGWSPTGEKLLTNDATLALYRKDFPAGTVTLGGNGGPSASSMYTLLLAAPEEPETPPRQASTAQGTPVSIKVWAGDSPVSLKVVSSPSHGQAFVNDDGTLSYEPDADFTGTDTVTYELKGSDGSIQLASLAITVSCDACHSDTVGETQAEPKPQGTKSENATSQYAIEIDLPPCDVHINSGESLRKANGSGRVFCVHPGSYGGVKLTANGSETSPRFLRYYNPNNPKDARHPVRMKESERAKVTGTINVVGKYWILNGLSYKKSGEGKFIETDANTHTVLDKLLAEGGGNGSGVIYLRSESTLQNSVLRSTYLSKDDVHCVVIGSGQDNVKVLSNEIYDCAGDAIQNHPGESKNILIADNDLYQTSAVGSGNTEQALDFKSRTGSDLSQGIRIENNRIWGITHGSNGTYRTAIIFTDDSKGAFIFRNNIVADVGRIMQGGGPSHPENKSIINNVFYKAPVGLLVRNFSKSEIYHNTFVDIGSWISDSGGGAATDMDILCNVMVNAPDYDSLGSGTVADYNAYYSAKQYAAPGTHDITRPSVGASANTDLCFERKRWTGPEMFCIPYARTTPESLHKGMCAKVQAGSRPGIGVDNAMLSNPDAGAVAEELFPSVD